MSIFQETGQKYRNTAMVRVREVCIESSTPVGKVLQSCRQMFELLDRSDDYQANISRKLWEFRATIMFTLLPFNSVELGLDGRLKYITSHASRIPEIAGAMSNFEKPVQTLLEHPENPKYQRIRAMSDCFADATPPEKTGFLSMMAMGRTFGWSATDGDCLDVAGAVQVIDSRKALTSVVFDRIIIPGTCQYLSNALFTDIFYQGRTRTVDIFLYPGEHFSLRHRLSPPESSLFRGCLTATRIACIKEHSSTVDENAEVDDDVSMKEGFWQFTHDGQKTPLPGFKPARYVLFKDSRGIFVPKDDHVLVWRQAVSAEDGELERVPVDRLAENDWLVMQPSDTGYLLDLESAEEGFGHKMEEACDWRPGLDALRLTISDEQIATEMLAVGAHGVSLVQSLRNWADGVVYGPGCQNELRALLQVLIRHGKIRVSSDIDQYVAEHWKGLQELRGIRHRAAFNVRREIHRQLSKAVEQLTKLDESHSILLEGGARVQLCQMAALDDQTSWVPVSSLLHLHFMRGGQWQG